ncbi:MAG TPA: hypothetical protein VHB21_11920, partial [Minicystis sp.]|nr:hypothetical protein [Minicystis sp.]
VPKDRAADVARFEKSGGFPDPIGAEALTLFAFDPAKTLHGKAGALDVPPTLAVGVVTVTLTVDGGAEIGVDALSKDAEQATRDAAALTKALDDATSIKISALRVHFVDPITFRADGEHVRGRRTVPPDEIAQLLAFARPRPARGASNP